MRIGIPRALLYYRYKTLWKVFFEQLGIETIISDKTDKKIMDAGAYYSIDEACLSSKLYLGHIDSLIDKCDFIFVPRIANYATKGILCTRFEAIYDMAMSTFRDKNVRFITLDVDLEQKKSEEKAYIDLGIRLGATKTQAKRAYEMALNAMILELNNLSDMQNKLLDMNKVRILIASHPYNLYDEYIGVPVTKLLKKLDVVPIMADRADLKLMQQQYTNICKDIPWIMSREIVGAVSHYLDKVDGIILMTAFPCGPDSMVNEMILRRVKNKPILNLLLDSQDGIAGVDTRLESFVDIIRFRRGEII